MENSYFTVSVRSKVLLLHSLPESLLKNTNLGLEVNWFKATTLKLYYCLELLIVFSLERKHIEEAGPMGPQETHALCPFCYVDPYWTHEPRTGPRTT